MNRRTLVLTQAAVTLGTLVAITGCTTGSGSPTSSASAPADQARAMRAVATCLRSHGYPSFPDPIQYQDGSWGFPDSAPKIGRTACDNLAKNAKSMGRPRDSDRERTVDLVKLRQYSVCMRQHGLADWPDPTPSGTFRLPTRLNGPGARQLLQPPDTACRNLLKGAHVSIDSGSGGKK
jgi:hypothetical protein